jgi:hypothetical protein
MSVPKCLLVAAIVAATPLVGPGAGRAADEGLATLQGTVRLDGQPLGFGRIIVHLPDGQFVGARLKDDGTYKIERVPPGGHKVTVEATVKGKSVLSPRYASEDETGLRFEVKEGKNMINLDLKSK